jgi:glutathione S-transferase
MTMMKLYIGKGSCALGLHGLIEELGLLYEPEYLDLANKQQRSPEYLAINPKGKVPALQLEGGQTVTEWFAIASYLSDLVPERALNPTQPLLRAQVIEVVDYVVGTVHMLGYSRATRPQNFCISPADHPAVAERGRALFLEGLAHLATRLEVTGFAVGDALTIADFAIFYVSFWAIKKQGLPVPDAIEVHYGRIRQLASIQRAMAAEGLC